MRVLELGVPDDYVPTDGEIDNIVYLVLKCTVGWQMRACDKAICVLMAGDIVGPAGISRLVEESCEYAYDHIAGEPDYLTPDKLFDHVGPVIETWFQSVPSISDRSITT